MKIGRVETGIPIPEATGKYGWFSKLGMGESVTLEMDVEDKAKAVKSGIRAAASKIGSRAIIMDQGNGSYRVWRLERTAAKPARKPRRKKGEAEGSGDGR